jgi:hypothetical protein
LESLKLSKSFKLLVVNNAQDHISTDRIRKDPQVVYMLILVQRVEVIYITHELAFIEVKEKNIVFKSRGIVLLPCTQGNAVAAAEINRR